MPSTRAHLSASQLEDLYASNSLAKNIVDIPAEDLTRNGWTIKMDNDKLQADLESRLKQLDAKQRFKDMFRYARLYGDGLISMGINTDDATTANLETKLDPTKVRKILYLNAFSGKKVAQNMVDEDVYSPTYGQVVKMRIENNVSSGNNPDANTKHEGEYIVDCSRLFHIQNLRFEGEIQGSSLLENIYDPLVVADTALWSVGQLLYDYSFKVFKSPDVANLTEKQKQELQYTAGYKFRTEALALISSEEDITKTSTNTTGVADLLSFVWDYLSGAARMPKSVIKGQESGTVTGAQYDLVNYYSRIASMQENSLRPYLERLVRLLIQASDEPGGALDPDKLDWKIEFNPLWNVDTETDAKIRYNLAQADQIYIANGVLSPEDVHDARFGQTGLNENAKIAQDGFTQKELDAMAKIVAANYNNQLKAGD